MSVTDEIKSRLDIVDIVSEYMPLRRAGSSLSGFCPFHSNTRTPAFAVFPNTQTWHCFGACSEGGDVFNFVMKKEGWDFREALVHLAGKAGVELDDYGTISNEQKDYEDRLSDILNAATDYFHQILLYAPQADKAREYIASRGFNEETIEQFKLGFSLESWDACRNHFNMQGYGDEELTDAGLLTVNEEKGSRYDRFRNRLMIPIRDVNGRMAGFGARTLDPEGLPKYLNSPQTAVFDKSRLLFGLDSAKRHIREARQAVIVEGYMDVIQAWQAGFFNVVAQMGTALTSEQLRLLKRYTKRFVLALDADAAGAQATMRGLEVARESLDRESDVRFNARGLVKHEGRLQADIQVVSLPQGYDPDKIIREEPEQWVKLIAGAKPVVTYVIDLATQDLDVNDGKAKTEAAKKVLPLISDVADPVEREHYRQLLARRLRIDERTLLKITIPSRQRQGGARQPTQPMDDEMPVDRAGADIVGASTVMGGESIGSELRRADFLRQCLIHPTVIPIIDQILDHNHQTKVEAQDFSKPDDRALWLFVRGQVNTWSIASEGDLWDSLEDEFLRDRVQSLLSLQDGPDMLVDRLPDTLTRSVLDWRLEHTQDLIEEVKFLFNDELILKDPDQVDLLAEQLRELTMQLLNINKARAAMTATGRRHTKEVLDGV
ncbi:MAG TPA: DNA primase [candidate division Zixibacteria bacterium]|nr:DNA primase [candidate division Zixibacteria bacterium]